MKSLEYRIQKFVRRNKAAVAAAAAIVLVLVLGVLVSAWMAVQADAARQEAIQAQQSDYDDD
jgi:uncharacterized protein HemX